jgi:hemerythrin-like domain-containing protein
MNTYNIDFPSIQSSGGWKHQIKHLWFNLTRKTDLIQLTRLVREILENTNLDSSEFDILIKLIKYTRDIHYGKGEQQISYMMLFELYKKHPQSALLLLSEFVHHYGSWRDIPYICDYISKTCSREHSFIYEAIDIMNNQLFIDSTTELSISNVAKWIPREKSKFSWLFDLLLENWVQKHIPHIFKYVKTNDQMIKAKSKASSIYRNVFVKLSSRLNLIETKLCNKTSFSDIDPFFINMKTMMKQWNTTFDMEFTHYNDPINNKLSIGISNYPISWLVEISKQINVNQIKNVDRINGLWKNVIKHNIYLGSCLPMIDISESIEKQNNLNHVIGIGLLIAKFCSFSDDSIRILFLGNEPLWYKHSNTDDYVGIIKDIFNFLPHLSNGNIISGFKLVSDSMTSSNLINPPTFILLTDKDFSSQCHHEIESIFHNKTFYVPRIIYWNFSKTYVQMDEGCFKKEPYFLSGMTISNFNILLRILDPTLIDYSLYIDNLILLLIDNIIS